MTASDPQSGLHYNKALDGVRGLAILLVVMSHSQLLHYGWTGVQLFFVLSGFLITSILLNEKRKPVSLRVKFRNFWARRVFRILPLYYLYLLIVVIIWWVCGHLSVEAGNLPSLFTFTYNFFGITNETNTHFLIPHLWTLSVEEQFYLVYPFLVLLCSQRWLRVIVIFLIAGAVAFRFFAGRYLIQAGLAEHEVGGFIYSSTFSHLDAFLLGGSISLFRIDRISLKLRYLVFFGIGVIALLYGLLCYLHIKPGHFNFNDYITHLGYTPDFIKMQHHVWSYFILNILFASLLLLLIPSQGRRLPWFPAKLFETNPLVAIGKVSYGMYIVQAGIRYLVLSMAHYCNIFNKYIIFLIYLPLLYAIALLLYRLYEKRFLALKEKFR